MPNDRSKTVFYVLVDSSTEGFSLYTHLRQQGCQVRIAPAPRGHTACCGMSIMADASDIPDVRAALDADPSLRYDRIIELENPIDPHRDVYC